MVDEFQDTDRVQWEVIDRAFSGHSTVILIGDPKQAIYAFRGGDIVTYLEAAETAGDKKTLDTNWRSDSALLDHLQVVLSGAQLVTPPSSWRMSRHTIRVTGSWARHTTIRFGCGWSREKHWAAAVFRVHPLATRESTSVPTSQPTSVRCWPAVRLSTVSR